MIDFIPLGSRIIVKTIDKEERVTKGGIIIPKTVVDGNYVEQLMFGHVIRVGGDVTLVKEGDKVAYLKYSARPFKLMDSDDVYSFIKESEVVGKMP